MRSDQTRQPYYIFGSAVITVVVGALIFITALAWNNYVQQLFDNMTNKDQELKAKLSYAFISTSVAITVGFMMMFFIEGDKW
jgi:uncharacterized membrane protein